MLKITLSRGLVGKTGTQRRIVSALGLGKYGTSVERPDSPVIRGMIDKVGHLVTVSECGASAKPASKAKVSHGTKKAKENK